MQVAMYEISSRFENQFEVICQDQWLYSFEFMQENLFLINKDNKFNI